MSFKANFPEDFSGFCFPEAVDVDNNEINNWIKECIKKLELNKEWDITSIASGNSKVIVMRSVVDNNEYYEVNVLKNYWTADVYKNTD